MAQSLYRQASLIMNPYGAKDTLLPSIKPTDGSGDFTFSRDGSGASPATRVNASGLIEKGRENLLLQSNQFDTTWTNSNSSETSGQAGYDGTNDAWLLESTATAASSFLKQNITNSGVYTMSVYAKAGTSNWLALATASAHFAYFDLQNGVVGSASGSNIIDYKIEQVGATDWYRCIMTSSNNNDFYIFIANNDGVNTTNSGDNIYIQDAQLEQGLVATDYIETTTAPVSAGLLGDMPRLDYSGGATCPSLLLEPSRVNSITNSEYFGAWTNDINTSLTANAIQSPSGFVDAYKLVAGTSVARQGIKFSLTPSGDIVQSVYAKKGEYSVIQISDGRNPNLYANFDLENGVIGSYEDCTPSIEPLKNDWYRCVITYNSTLDINVSRISIAESTTQGRLVDFAGNGTDGIYIYGAQVEVGSYPTSYIPTYGSAVTRNVDATGVTGASSIIGQSEGTIYWEGYIDVSKSSYGYFPRLFSVSSTSTNWLALLLTQSNELRAQYVVNGSADVQITHQISTSGNYKIAFAYNDNDFNCFVNGVSVGTNTTATTTIALNDIYLGMENGATLAPTSQDTKQAILFDTRLSNTELAALTTI